MPEYGSALGLAENMKGTCGKSQSRGVLRNCSFSPLEIYPIKEDNWENTCSLQCAKDRMFADQVRWCIIYNLHT